VPQNPNPKPPIPNPQSPCNKFRITNILINFKNELYDDLEKINLKMLNEIQNQANEIQNIYKELQNLNKCNISNNSSNISNIYTKPQISKIKSDLELKNKNIIEILDLELSKKANLDQLNFALETQSKLNEAFSSSLKIARYSWDSEGELKEEKFVIWSIQNINTALDIFKWEKNSENIKILQNGVYKVVFGLIGIEKGKKFGIIFNDNENIIMDSNSDNNDNENDINNDKENIVFIEKYIACVENTNLKAIIYDSKNNESTEDSSDEAFLEITKII